ncbi:hypothetical protein AB205_0127550 [Aquarana catesbeiana]|uniref:Uncharacterized protein n=1 Tax=Aquarana catesbeiana TaxID=8400 RepID=A0A2G9RL40_AQUCT|nr:hypothetical protein AB205_0127550 [Aquarana catesbeiana]
MGITLVSPSLVTLLAAHCTGILPTNIKGQQSQQMVKYGVRHPEKVPEIIRIILTDLTEQRHVIELVTLKQPILGP